MFYYVENYDSSILSHSDLDEAIAFGSYFLDLDIDNIINIRYISASDPAWGYCDEEDDEYVIEINEKLTQEEKVETLFHEMVHIKQIASGVYDPDFSTWHGKRYDCNYLERPWEIEAFDLQEKMTDEYFCRQ